MKTERNNFEYTDELNCPIEAFVHESSPDNFPILPHWHYFIEIIHVLKGELEVTCGDSVYVMRHGDLMIFCAQKLHSIDILQDTSLPSGLQKDRQAKSCRIYENAPAPLNDTLHRAVYPVPRDQTDFNFQNNQIRYQVFKFDLKYINMKNSFDTQFSASLSYLYDKDPSSIFFSEQELRSIDVTRLMNQTIEEMKMMNFAYTSYVSSMLTVFLVDLMRIWIERGLNLNELIRHTLGDNNPFDDITKYIEQHYNENIQVQMLADRCGMSYSYFAKKFRKIYNQSCKDYIDFIRINKVQELLLFTDLDLNYISQETGFSDCSHLIRTFKKKMGTTPKQWRKSQKNR